MKVLHILGQLDVGGIECWLKDFISLSLKKNENTQYHIIIDKPHFGNLEQDFLDLGVIVHRVRPNKSSKLKYLSDINRIMRSEKFDVVHSHVSFTCGIINFIGYINKINNRITHIHSDRIIYIKESHWFKKIEIYFLLLCIELFSTKKITVSKKASEIFLIKSNYDVIPCGKDFSPLYSPRKNSNEVDLKKWTNNSKILITVGRLEKVKNHSFLLDIMKIIDDEFKLIIIGDGSLRIELQNKIYNNNLSTKVKLLGTRHDCLALMKEFGDVFLFPSAHEGLGMAAIEAQACGLPVICSDNIPSDVKLTNNLLFLSIDNLYLWIDEIEKLKNKKQKMNLDIIQGEFSIEKNLELITNIYVAK